MKKTLILIIGILFLVSCKADPSNKQIEFAKALEEEPYVLKTEWGTSLSLVVIVDLNALGNNPKMQAQLLADQIVAKGVEYTGENTCTLIYYGDYNKLAEACLNK